MTRLSLSAAPIKPNTDLVYHWTCPGEDIAHDLEDLAIMLPAAAATISDIRALCLAFPDDRISIEGNARRFVIRGPKELMARLSQSGLASPGECEEVHHEGLIDVDASDLALLDSDA